MKIRRGVSQGCVPSLRLFKVYSGDIIAEALTNLEVGIQIKGEYINNLCHADDTVRLAASLRDLVR